MAENATGGPTIVFGQQPANLSVVPYEYNNEAAPSIFWAGTALLDPRYGYYAYGGAPHALGVKGENHIPVIVAAPFTLSTTIIAASQAVTTGVALTLANTSTTGLTVLSAGLVVYPSRNTVPSGALALDGVPGLVVFDTQTGNGVQLYDPTKALARNVRISSPGNDGAGTYTVKGYDLYGYPMSETITGGSGATVSGAKAWKFVTSITPAGTIGSSTTAVGTGDVYGFPLRADSWGDTYIVWANTINTSSLGFTAAVTSTATSTTGDVRGTYAVPTASNGTNVLQVFITPRVSNISTPAGLFGVTPA